MNTALKEKAVRAAKRSGCVRLSNPVYDEDKREYYAALQQYDEAEDLDMLYRVLTGGNLAKANPKLTAAGTYDERRYIINEEWPGEFKKLIM